MKKPLTCLLALTLTVALEGSYQTQPPFGRTALAQALESPEDASEDPPEDDLPESSAQQLLEQGLEEFTAQNPEAAIATLQQALELFQLAGDRAGEGQVWKALGNAYFLQENYPLALQAQEQALEIAQERQDPDLESRAYINIGRVYRATGDLEAAVESYVTALEAAKELNDANLNKLALQNLVIVLSDQEDYAQALDYLPQLIDAAQQTEDIAVESFGFSMLSWSHSWLEQYEQGIEFGQRGLELAQQTENSTLLMLSLVALSAAHNGLEQYAAGVEYGQQALELAQQTNNIDVQTRSYIFLLTALSELNRHQEIVDIGQQALDHALQTENPFLQVIALVLLGYSHNELNQYETAFDQAQRALELIQQLELADTRFQALSLVVLSTASTGLGQSEAAIEYGQQAFDLVQPLDDADLQATIAVALVEAYSEQEQYDVAIALGQQILETAQSTQNRELEIAALGVLSSLHSSLYNFSQSIDYANRALEINQSVGNAELEISVLLELIGIYDALGAYPELAETAQQIASAAERLPDASVYPVFKWMESAFLSYIAYLEEDISQAIEFAEESRRIAASIDTATEAIDANWLEKISDVILAIAYGETDNYLYALDLLAASEAFWRQQQYPENELLALNIAGGIYRYHNQADLALQKHQQALSIAAQQGDVNDVATAHAGLARSYRALDKPVTAIFHYKEAINRIESIRDRNISLDPDLQTSLLEQFVDFGRVRLVDLYREMADLLLSQGRVLEAQQVLELLKKQELQDYTRNQSDRPDLSLNNIEAEIQAEYGSLIAFGQRVSQCQQENCGDLPQLTAQLNELTTQFNQSLARFETQARAETAEDSAMLATEDFRRAAFDIVEAEPGTVLIYPLILEDKLWLLWAGAGGVLKSYEVDISQAEVTNAVLRFRQLLNTPNSDVAELEDVGKTLYNWFIQPIEDELDQNAVGNLVFSLDRAARYIPMAMLHDGEHYLIEKYAVSTVLSADLTDTSERFADTTEDMTVLAMGTSEAVGGFQPLPNVEDELNSIVLTDRADQEGIYAGQVFLNGEFDFSTLQLNLLNSRVLHLATHGEFNPGQPEDSYLLLGTGEQLRPPDIDLLTSQLRNTHLVVLSACETGLGGRNADGIEISGVSYYFINSGAKAVVASLWQVNDNSTSLLMQRFYQLLASGELTKAEALRQAQLSLLYNEETETRLSASRSGSGPNSQRGIGIATASDGESTGSSYQHPYYWAPFVLIGNGL
ncbi:MAG: CHAT domain-containing protein [Cyanobacteria bacterium P01_H01_bin.119]